MDKAIIATVDLASLSPYSQSKYVQVPKEDKESADAYEKRTWMSRVHTNEKGHIIIPGIQVKKSLEGAAKLLKKKIPGKGASTWTQHIIGGVSPLTNLDTGLTPDQVAGEWIHCDAQGGTRGNGSRVLRCYPMIASWRGQLEFIIWDREVTEDIFTEFLNEAGLLVGIGRYRAACGGTKGKFAVLKVAWRALGMPEIQKRLLAA